MTSAVVILRLEPVCRNLENGMMLVRDSRREK
jgi:hypothetical protein